MPKPSRRPNSSSEPARAVLGILIGMLIGAIGVLAVALIAWVALTYAAISPPVPVAAVPEVDDGIPDTGKPPTAAPSLTAYLPRTWTPTASATSTATPTATATVTPTATETTTPTPTATVTETSTSTPTDTPLPPTTTPSDGLPAEMSIVGVIGYTQSMPLSCESRSAVDWARFFGVHINEMDFQNALPYSDNPNTGFVGNPNDERGSIPPDSYGVHAPPVAGLLRAYGLNAVSASGLSFTDLRREIAAGQPVIAWVIGNTWTRSNSTYYTAADGQTVLVAPYEHTVIVIGYTQETVTVVDGSMIYSTTIDRFLTSWGVLGNQGVLME